LIDADSAIVGNLDVKAADGPDRVVVDQSSNVVGDLKAKLGAGSNDPDGLDEGMVRTGYSRRLLHGLTRVH